MCGIEPYSHILLWIFVAGSLAMAVLSRKLNDHLLVPPPPPKSLWFRRKNHIRPSYLLKPDRYFDATGQQWAWRFTLVTAVTVAAGALALYAMAVCREGDRVPTRAALNANGTAVYPSSRNCPDIIPYSLSSTSRTSVFMATSERRRWAMRSP